MQLEELQDNTTKRILVVEDDPGVRYILTQILKLGRYTVISADSGTDGLSLLAEDFDLITLDMELTDMDGGEFLDKLKQQSKNKVEAGFNITAPPPVLIITGDPYNVSPVYSCGLVKGLLCKPFTLHEVLQAVQTCLGSLDRPDLAFVG